MTDHRILAERRRELQSGDALTITWKLSNITSSTITIGILDNRYSVETAKGGFQIAQVTATGSGSYAWKIPAIASQVETGPNHFEPGFTLDGGNVYRIYTLTV